MSEAAALLLKRYATEIGLIRNHFGLPYHEHGEFTADEWAKKNLYERLDKLADDMQNDAAILLKEKQNES